MKTYVKFLTCTAVLISIIVIASEFAVDDKNLIGAWKSTETKLTFPSNPNQEPIVIKNPRPSIFIFTRKYFSWVAVHDEPATELTKDSAPNAYVAIYNQLLAFSGIYDVKGNSIEAHVMVSKNPKDMSKSTTLNFEYKFEGNTLVITLVGRREFDIELKMIRLE
jgi:hypothetical protein